MLNDKLKNYLHLHFIIFIWGFTAILGALISVDAVSLVWYRILLAVIFLYAYIIIKKFSLHVPKQVLLGMVVTGIIIALHWITFFMAIKVSNVSVTLATISTAALFTSILEPIWYKRKMIWYEVMFGLIVVVGLYVIFDVDKAYVTGIILALISAFLASVFSLINGKYVKKYRASVISFYELISGFIFITVYFLFTGQFNARFFSLLPSDWLYLILLASVCTTYAFIAGVHVMKHLTPYTVMLTVNLEPVYGIILAFFILGDEEKMSPQFYFGALIILSVVIINGILKNSLKKKSSSGLLNS
ncbi:DMT family transporter [Abyssalbus ytuae]|uniref:DMT family transporter n=1 Tax=Abyssalbus ytuae TaxID=2926907 RepID=A0A9E7CUE7_9FLAO|nr:DMT family transporter [Abyssalbus ytuae]UOB18282.1 DMT family transporter [Abyssalbus ytuae]